MKTKYYTKILLPLCLFCALFRFLELAFAVEYSIDSYFYVSGSIIPVIFNVFIGLCIVFFASYWAINKVKTMTSASEKEKKEKLKAVKAEGKEAYKAYVNDNKTDIELKSDFARMKKLDVKTTILYVIASILILAFAAQLFLNELNSNAFFYTSVGDIFKTFAPYIFITALLSVLFFVQFSASPKATAKGKFWMVISFAPALFYTLLVFYTFHLHSGIISKVFVAFDFLKIAALALSLVSIPQLFVSSSHKSIFFSSSIAAVFLSTIRFTDGVVSMLAAMGLGDGILPMISHLDKIDVDPLLATGDFCLSIALLLTAIRLCKKTKKKKAVNEPATEDTLPEEEISADEALAEEPAEETSAEEPLKEAPVEEPTDQPAEEVTDKPEEGIPEAEEAPSEDSSAEEATEEEKAEELAIESEAAEESPEEIAEEEVKNEEEAEETAE